MVEKLRAVDSCYVNLCVLQLYLQQRGDRNSWNGTTRELSESGDGGGEDITAKVGYWIFIWKSGDLGGILNF